MNKFKFRLKENNPRVLKPSEVDPSFLKNIETQYGKINMEDDFFSPDLETYYKVDSKDRETGGISHTLIKLASFDDLIDSLSKANNSSGILKENKSLQSDNELQTILNDVNKLFNKFRTHLRNKYPEEYKKFNKSNLDEESTSNSLSSIKTPYAFKLNKKIINEAELTDFQNQRIKAFDNISSEMNNIYKILSNAKNKTSAYYNAHPESTEVIYPTELINDYISDIKVILNQEK